MDFRDKIRVVKDFPQPGVQFKDITTLLKDGKAFRQAIQAMIEQVKGEQIDLIVGPEARGFVVGTPFAYALGVGFIPVRKPGKLPAETISASYSLEYGKDQLALHKDAIQPGQRVLIVDDLLATGGTVKTTVDLVEQLGGHVVGASFVVELTYLNGRDQLSKDLKINSLIQY
ncbi:adenine phosphoribosyltransferase [Mechercharimyces sp. CAU 1602]|uniref:adenine phosphoribosyltransferase n=1 Tax=Mechercharimyces sp. CAU 1602 TaxID=2973933 RepID=UPI002162494D|nr:adenine phosphoribosyltransferase [Mechercharimyces sp. CAU 1602]MCS1350688.1 adenine phosphoribosyltransferase [Mechercharimyces sp. CAU 1602]